MYHINRFLVCIILLPLSVFGLSVATNYPEGKIGAVLVFYKTAAFHHESISDGVKAIQKLGIENGFRVEATNDASAFTNANLKNYKAVVFLSTTGDVLNDEQQNAFQKFIEGGGGFVGIHAAADAEYDWPWYNKLVGAYFLSHPHIQTATINVVDKNHPATKMLPDKWQRTDEWYNFKDIQPDMKVLAYLDENSYSGGKNGHNHPFAWYHSVGKGKSFYTAGGHTKESYTDPLFLQHILGAIEYVTE
jgi:type 1 glutamine amidotransferase